MLWYSIPDPNGFSYGWTKIEGIILDIIPTNTGIHEFSRPQTLEVYPNPASDVLYIKNLSGGTVHYSIFNILGQQVAAGSTDGSINVAELGKGVYVLQIKSEKFRKTAKFVVE